MCEPTVTFTVFRALAARFSAWKPPAGFEKVFPPSLHTALLAGRDTVTAVLVRTGAKTDVFALAGLGRTEELKKQIGRQGDKKWLTATDGRGRTALHYAAAGGRALAAEMLITRGADVNARSQLGQMPLHLAVYARHVTVVHVLLRRGAKVDAPGIRGETPLYAAAEMGHPGLVLALLARKADVRTTCADGTTALHAAAANGHRNACRLLVDRGADLNAKDSRGRTPLDLAELHAHKATVILLHRLAIP